MSSLTSSDLIESVGTFKERLGLLLGGREPRFALVMCGEIWMSASLASMRGEKIIVRAWGNRPLVRVVWDVRDETVLVTNEQGLASLESGEEAPMPIGFRFCDVFFYDEESVEGIMTAYATGQPLQWESLQRFSL